MFVNFTWEKNLDALLEGKEMTIDPRQRIAFYQNTLVYIDTLIAIWEFWRQRCSTEQKKTI